MRSPSLCLWALSAALAAETLPTAGAECGLPDAILAAARTNITIEGISMPFGIGVLDWVSGRLLAYIADILLQEILGLNTALTGPFPSTVAGTYALMGCTHPNAVGEPLDRGCSPTHTVSTTHVTLESWDSAMTPFFFEALVAVMGEAALPIDLGSVGYDGFEGLYVPTKPRLAAMDSAGLPLEYFKTFNVSWHDTSQYFNKYSDIPTTGLLKCSQSKFATESVNQKYLEITNDTGGVEVVNGRLVSKCHGGIDGYWWFAPACRHDPETCIPVLDGGDGWSTDVNMQRATTWNIPLALAVGTWGTYCSEPIDLDMLFYWWSPDTAFITLRPTPVMFPPTDTAEWAVGRKTTDSQKVPLKTRVHYALPDSASRASELVGNIQLTMAQLEALLFETAENASKPETDIACDWLKANPEIWTKWVPYQTKCAKGWGLVSSTGAFVTDRVHASDCDWCPPGMHSKKTYDTSGPTAICVFCEKGTYQPSPGQSVCLECEPGYFTDVEGESECQACPIGTYAELHGSPTCTACGGGAKLWTTMRKLTVRGADKWVSTESATSQETCGCDVGARLDAAGACIECMIEGVECLGMNDVVVSPGYYSPLELDVFKCLTAKNCKGGVPGDTCAEGREGIACASCKTGLQSGDGGACVPCTGGDYVPFAFLVCFVLLACFVLYWGIDRGGGGQPTHAVLLLGISGGLLVALMQQLSVLSMLNVTYTEPLRSFWKIVSVFTFKVEDYIHLDCLGKMRAAFRFTTKVCLIFATCLLMTIIHIGFVIFKYQRRFAARTPSLIAVFGTLAMVFYISVTVTILQPFQCNQNPNGQWTTQAYEDVICWEPSVDRDHQAMLAVGVVALIMPILLFAKVLQLVRQFPTALKSGNIRFLQSYGFLFFRFRPHAHWYIMIIMSRSLFVGMVPIIPKDIAQIYAFQVALLICFATCIHYKPWRVPFLNFMDAFFGAVMILFMNITAFLVKETSLDVLGWVCVCMVVLALAALLSLFLLALMRHCGQLTKPYRFFLCHCKAEAGAFARWLKLELVSNPQVKQEVFLDSDNLESLDCLLGHVATEVSTLVVIATKTLFFRPWCVGEITTAHANAVNNIVLEMPDFEPLTAEAIETFESVVPDVESICVDNAIPLQAVRQALTVFSMKERVGVPTTIAGLGMTTLAKMLIAGTQSGSLIAMMKQEPVMLRAPSALIQVGIVRDRTVEANAIAFVLQRLMVRYTCFAATGAPEVICLHDDQDCPGLKKALLLCTQGCFSEFSYLNVICELSDKGTHILPVLGDDEFRVPRRDIFLTIQAGQLRPLSQGGLRNTEMVARIVVTIFKEIAVPFKAKIDRYVALDSAAARVAKRLTEPPYERGGSQASHRGSIPEGAVKGESEDKRMDGFDELDDAELVVSCTSGEHECDGLGLNIERIPRPFENQLTEFMVGFGRDNA